MENSGKRAARIALLAIMLIASLAMTGCGKRLVMTRGYGKQELFRVGNTNCTLPEYKKCSLLIFRNIASGLSVMKSGKAVRAMS